jgi:hypothetical protein
MEKIARLIDQRSGRREMVKPVEKPKAEDWRVTGVHPEYGLIPANRRNVEELVRLVPERAEVLWQLWHAGKLGKVFVEQVLAEARKPRMLPTASGEAERLHAQSGEVLAHRQREELRRAEALARARRSERSQHSEAEWELARRQAVIDYWQNQKLAAAENERYFREGEGIEAYDRNVIWGRR